MKLEEFRRSVSDIDDDLIADAYACEEQIKRKRTRGRRVLLFVSLLVLTAAALSLSLFFALRKGEEAPVEQTSTTAPTDPKTEPSSSKTTPTETIEQSPEPTPAATVYIEGKIGVSFVVSEDRTVLRVDALDDSAQKLLGDDEFIEMPLGEAVGKITSTMIDNNYLSSEDDALLLTVDAPKEIAEPIGEEVEKSIRAVANESQPGSTGLVLTIILEGKSRSERINALIENYGVSRRTATMIACIAEVDKTRTCEELVRKSDKQLSSLCRNLNLRAAKISSEAALRIALSDAGLDESEAVIISNNIENSFDYKFEISFNTVFFRYKIDCFSGQVIYCNRGNCLSEKEIFELVRDAFTKIGLEFENLTITLNNEKHAYVWLTLTDGNFVSCIVDAETHEVKIYS